MKKNKYTIYVLAIFIIIIFALLLSSCSMVRHTANKMFPYSETSCPTNDSKFFFRQAGVKPTRQYMMSHR